MSFSGISSNCFCLFMAVCLQLLLLRHMLVFESSFIIVVGIDAIHFSEASGCCGSCSMLLKLEDKRF